MAGLGAGVESAPFLVPEKREKRVKYMGHAVVHIGHELKAYFIYVSLR